MAENLVREKQRAATLSLAFNVLSTIVKFIAAILTGSVSLLSEAIHSATDIVSSSIALVSVRAASAPPDEEHPWGHGKIESLAGFGEAVMLFLIVIYILIESVVKLVRGAAIQQIDIGIWVMAASSVGAFLTSRYVSGVGKRTASLALVSNGQHLQVDFWTSVGVFAALLFARLTGYWQADPIIAIALALWIAFGAYRLSIQAFHELIDVRLPESEIARIDTLLNGTEGLISYHKLRTRRSGSARYIDLHVVVPSEWSLIRAHELADRVEKQLESDLAPAYVVVHVDPDTGLEAEPD